ncbi:MAG: type II toxin-antitoxin system death-on-curing family toxin [Beutenbergiaceae bacterium]
MPIAPLDEQAAELLESLVSNHALADGNRRIGWLATVVFYGLDGVNLEAPDDDAYRLVVGVASGDVGYQEAAVALARWQ